MKSSIKYSIIIKISTNDINLDKYISSFYQLHYPNEEYEIIIVNQNNIINLQNINITEYKDINISFVGEVPKLNIMTEAIKKAKGKIIVFFDSNTKPVNDCLSILDNFYSQKDRNRTIIIGSLSVSETYKNNPFNLYLLQHKIINFNPIKSYIIIDNDEFRLNCSAIPTDLLEILLKESKKMSLNFTNEIGYLLNSQGGTIYYLPDFNAEIDGIHTSELLKLYVSKLGFELIQFLNKYPFAKLKYERLSLISSFDENSYNSIAQKLKQFSEMETLDNILDSFKKISIDSELNIPIGKGKVISKANIMELFSKYCDVFVTYHFNKGILNGIAEHGYPIKKQWELSQISNTNTNSNKKKKILLTMFGWNDSGGGTILPKDIAQALNKNKFDVGVFYAGTVNDFSTESYKKIKSYDGQVQLYGIFNRTKPFTYEDLPEMDIEDKQVILYFEDVINEFQPDIIHFHNFLGLSFKIAEIAANRGIPTIFTPHNYHVIDPKLYLMRSPTERWSNLDLFTNSPLLDFFPHKENLYLERKRIALEILNKQINFIFAISQSMKNILMDFGVNENKISVLHQIPRSVDNIKKKKKSDQSNKIRFGFLGAVMPHKGIHKLIEAANMMRKEDCEINVWGDYNSNYIEKLNGRDLNQLIVFHGGYHRDDLNSIFDTIDVLIVPSICFEGAGLVIIEARKAGVPIIVAKIGGIPEFIQDGFNGLLYNPDSESQLYKLMKALILTPEILRNLQKNTTLSVKFKSFISHLENLYSKISANSPIDTNEIDFIIT